MTATTVTRYSWPTTTSSAGLLLLAIAGYLRIEDVVPARGPRNPDADLARAGGFLAGLAAVLVARLVNAVGSRRRSDAAARSLRLGVDEVARELILDPVSAELAGHEHLRVALADAKGGN